MHTADGITAFLNAIRELSGAGICYYDLNSFFHYEKYGVKNNRGHYCAFCERARSLPNGRANCEKSDRTEAVLLARQYKEPFFYECHMGMRELIVPLLREERLLGILFVGQCRTVEDQSTAVRAGAERLGGDADEMLSLYEALPVVPQRELVCIGTLLSQYFDSKILNTELLSSGSAAVHGGDSAHAVRSYIDANYRYGITPGEIAKEFHLNAAYISRIFRKRYGVTVTDYIRTVRMARARILLRTTDAPVHNIALNVGYEDGNYFSRLFKQETGLSPQAYRKDAPARE